MGTSIVGRTHVVVTASDSVEIVAPDNVKEGDLLLVGLAVANDNANNATDFHAWARPEGWLSCGYSDTTTNRIIGSFKWVEEEDLASGTPSWTFTYPAARTMIAVCVAVRGAARSWGSFAPAYASMAFPSAASFVNGFYAPQLSVGGATQATSTTSSGSTLVKTGGADFAFNAGASGGIPLTGDCYVEFTIHHVDRIVGQVGFSVSDPDQGQIGWGAYCYFGDLHFREGGASVFSDIGGAVVGQRIRVERSGSTIRMYRQGVLVYTSLTPANGTIYLDTTFYNTGAQYTDIRLYVSGVQVDIPWRNIVNVTITDNVMVSTNDGYRITKTGGALDYNAGASSVESLAGDGYAECVVDNLTTSRFFGLSESDPDADFDTIKFGIQIDTNQARARELGNVASAWQTLSTGDVLRVERTGSSIAYKLNGITFHTSSLSSSAPLYVDTSILNTSAMVKGICLVSNGQKLKLTWKNLANAAVIGEAPLVNAADSRVLYFVAGFISTVLGVQAEDPSPQRNVLSKQTAGGATESLALTVFEEEVTSATILPDAIKVRHLASAHQIGLSFVIEPEDDSDSDDTFKAKVMRSLLPPPYNTNYDSNISDVIAIIGESDNDIGGLFGDDDFLPDGDA